MITFEIANASNNFYWYDLLLLLKKRTIRLDFKQKVKAKAFAKFINTTQCFNIKSNEIKMKKKELLLSCVANLQLDIFHMTKSKWWLWTGKLLRDTSQIKIE